LLGRREEARALLVAVNASPAAALAEAELAARHGRFVAAHARLAASTSPNPLLRGELLRMRRELERPAFRFLRDGAARSVSLVEVEALPPPYVDVVRRRCGAVDLALRPVALALAAALARGPVTAEKWFGRSSESLRVRLRMEISRLRRLLGIVIESRADGFVVRGLGLLLPEGTTAASAIDALLGDGEAWTATALAAVLGRSVRSVERDVQQAETLEVLPGSSPRRYRRRDGRQDLATRMLLLAKDAPAVEASANRHPRRTETK
jgi:hypothetical protein